MDIIIKTQQKLGMYTSYMQSHKLSFAEDLCNHSDEHSSPCHSPSLLKYPQINLKLTISLAETCEQDSSRKESWQGSISDRNSIQSKEQQLQLCELQQYDQLCQQFHEEGYCFKGKRCDRIHITPRTYEQKQQSKSILMNWILNQNPDLLLEELNEKKW